MTHFFFIELQKVASLKNNLATDNNTRGIGNKAYDRKSAHALSTGALTNHCHTFTLVDIVGEVVDCLYLSFSSEERGSQVFYFQNFFSDGLSPHFFYFIVRLLNKQTAL